MGVQLLCMSHTPVMNKVTLPAPVDEEVRAAILAARAKVDAMSPDLIVLFGPDHFNGVMNDMMPAFCVGAMAHAVGDYGTLAGPLPVPTPFAEACAAAVLDAGVDVAVSHRLRVDHGFTQTLELLTGGIDRVPVLPIFVNCIAKPMTRLLRVRLLGDSIGRYLRREFVGHKVLVVGSGGISHDPPVPALDNAPDAVRFRLINGIQRTSEEQLAHEARVVAAARAFARADAAVGGGGLLPLNPNWDRWVLGCLCAGDFASLEAMDNDEICAQGGSGGQEIRTWIAAFACLGAVGRFEAHVDYYRALADWIAGFAIASGHVS